MAKTIVNWGVLGCAGIAEKHTIPGLLAASNARLHAVASRSDSPRLAAFKQKFSPDRVYTSYEALLEDPAVDAVYIPLPNGLHKEWVLKAAAHKKHILCEKPLGINAQEVADMKKACEENGVLLMEAFAYRQSPLTHAVKQLVEEGAIGQVRFVSATFTYRLENIDDVRMKASLSGGATYDIGCYNIDIIRHIIGQEPVTVSAIGEVGAASGVDESSCILMGFENGAQAVSFCSFKGASNSDYRITGDQGILDVPARFNSAGLQRIVLTRGDTSEEIRMDCPDNYRLQIEQFGRCIINGEAPAVSLESSLGNAQVIDRALAQIHEVLQL